MNIGPITIQPFPLPAPHPGGNTGVVPPWLRRDLGVEATQPTVKGHEMWRADFRK